jgi:hypothetical protein
MLVELKALPIWFELASQDAVYGLMMSTEFSTDANLFKEAFIKAQQENEKIFGEAAAE